MIFLPGGITGKVKLKKFLAITVPKNLTKRENIKQNFKKI